MVKSKVVTSSTEC